MKFDQDLRLNLRYDFGKMKATLESVVPLAMFQFNFVESVLNGTVQDTEKFTKHIYTSFELAFSAARVISVNFKQPHQ